MTLQTVVQGLCGRVVRGVVREGCAWLCGGCAGQLGGLRNVTICVWSCYILLTNLTGEVRRAAKQPWDIVYNRNCLINPSAIINRNLLTHLSAIIATY